MLGSPIAHSLSPVLHRAAYDALGLADWTYEAVETVEADLEPTLRRLADAGLAGVSLTMPLKKSVMPLLMSVDEAGATVGAANTVLFADDAWRGANTDVAGFVAALRGSGLLATADPPWVIGAGATAGSAIAALASCGYRSVIVVARRPAAGEQLRPMVEALGLGLEVRPWSDAGKAIAASLVIATTPAGATDQLAPAVRQPDDGGTLGLWFDVGYAPWPTRVAAAWQAAGGQVIGGIELLIEQAAEQVRLMTGLAPPVAAMRDAGHRAVAAP